MEALRTANYPAETGGPNISNSFASPIILAQSGTPISLTGTTVETVLASITLPKNIMGPQGSIRISTLWSCTNSANIKTPRIKCPIANFMSIALSTTNALSHMTIVRNRGSLNSQVGFNIGTTGGGFGQSGSNNVNYALDTSVDQVISFTGQLALGTETITLEGYTIEVLPGA